MGFGGDLHLLDGYLMDLPDPGRLFLQDVDSRRHTSRDLLDWYLTGRSDADANTSEAGLESLIVRHITGTDGLAVAPGTVAKKPDVFDTGCFAGSPKDYDRAYLS
jgi:hypothetical protein